MATDFRSYSRNRQQTPLHEQAEERLAHVSWPLNGHRSQHLKHRDKSPGLESTRMCLLLQIKKTKAKNPT